uniref:Macrophage expressed protein-like isoform 2 n=1 Tax=Littorina littorea TaxID=31216 RepID=A0A165X525_LITLI|nr:macrophage expressed protein-like isoform 2 [Littorina littorea]
MHCRLSHQMIVTPICVASCISLARPLGSTGAQTIWQTPEEEKMWSWSPHLLAIAVMCAVAADNANGESLTDNYPIGNPWYCLEMAKAKGYHMEIMEVLPGFGWDNLRNVNEGQVVSFNYTKCRTTGDGRFLLPDSVSAVPIKTSRMQFFAELISDWKMWTSTNSKSININAGLKAKYTTISGKFSTEFSEVKSKQIGDKTSTMRTQLRYIRYKVQQQSYSQLHPVFKKQVLDIAAALTLGEDNKADFLSELLVRKFGTHIVTQADAGAALIQVEQLDEQWVVDQTKESKKTDILAVASFNFYGFLRMSLSTHYSTETSEEFKSTYYSMTKSSRVFSEGGSPVLPGNFTAATWAQSFNKDLVALDRSGNPLYYVITKEALPELSISVLQKVYEGVKQAVETYHLYNRIPGCVDPASPNFSPAANVNDDSCIQPSTNLTFGGMYQQCVPRYASVHEMCRWYNQVNPLTGAYSCPSGYSPVLIHGADVHNALYYYGLFWCVALSPTPSQSGYLFGGVYTSTLDNPVTDSQSCPPSFFPLRIGDGLHLSVCVNDNHEIGKETAVPLGGFYTCSMGNPFAMEQTTTLEKRSEWPKRCPPGYSSHIATVDQGCYINYCVTTGSLTGHVFTPIKRPPFSADPFLSPSQVDDEFSFDPASDTWKISNKTNLPGLPTASPLVSSPSAGDSAILFSWWMLVASLSMSFVSA